MDESVSVKPRSHDAVVLAVAFGAVGATALLRLVPGINQTTVGFVLLLIVLSTASLASMWMSILVAVAGTLALNFFYLPPVGTFTIADPQNWIALAAFLAAALIASNLSTAAQTRAREAI